MREQIAKNIRERNLFRDGERILVAVSGGVDSLALLDALSQLASARRWKLTVAHLNHKLRGRESDADETLVGQTAKSLGLKFVTDSGDVQARAKQTGQSVEMAARELRHRFLAQTARKLKIKTIALAHHADDQVELFFLRVLRGASVDGLAGMKWRSASPQDKTIQLVRPMLNISRQQIETYAREQKLRWREDTSNQSRDFLRNRVRGELIPLLEKDYQPALRKTVLRTMELLADESEVVAALTKKPGTFAKLPVAIQRRLLQQQLFEHGLSPDFDTIERLRTRPSKIIELNQSTRVTCDKQGRIKLSPVVTPGFSDEIQKVQLGAKNEVQFADCDFTFRVVEKSGAKFTPHRQTESFDADKIGSAIILRHWRPGDRFHPIGAKSTRKLQDIFVDLKISKPERHNRVIATTAGGEIFWVEGVRIGENFKLTSQTKRRLLIEWHRG